MGAAGLFAVIFFSVMLLFIGDGCLTRTDDLVSIPITLPAKAKLFA
jgi:hypothetical protein